MKTCCVCGHSKSVAEFPKKTRNEDGLDNRCKACKRAYDNAHYAANPGRKVNIRASAARIRQDTFTWVREYLESNPCVDCGESDIVVLQFDHQKDKLLSVSVMIRKGYRLAKIQEEIDKCQVRCANCHTRKTASDYGWWRTK